MKIKFNRTRELLLGVKPGSSFHTLKPDFLKIVLKQAFGSSEKSRESRKGKST